MMFWVSWISVVALGLVPQSHDLPRQLHFQRISIEEGLSQSTVFGIAQDHQGFLWFGSEGGLNKYDGYAFTHYMHDSNIPSSLSDNWVRCLWVDQKGRLWIGNRVGLDLLEESQESFKHVIGSTQEFNDHELGGIAVLVEDEDGEMWAGSFNSGLFRIDRDMKVHHYAAQDGFGLEDDRVRALLPSGNYLWIGTKNGLFRMDRKSQTIDRVLRPENSALSNREIRALLEDETGALWIGTTHGLNRYDPNSGMWQSYFQEDVPGSLSDNWINTLVEDERGRIWVGTRDGGLNVLLKETDTFLVYRHDNFVPTSLSSNNIIAIFKDDSGVVWVGGFLSGINKLSAFERKFQLLQNHPFDPSTLIHNTVRSIMVDQKDQLWVGTINGVSIFNENREAIRHLVKSEDPVSLSENQILCMTEDTQGQIWMGTYGNGLDIISPNFKTIRHITKKGPEGLPDNFPQVLLRDRDRKIWLGSRSGLYAYDPESDRFFPSALAQKAFSDFDTISILSCFQDSRGRIWTGTYGRGAWCMDLKENSFRDYRKSGINPTLSHDYVSSFGEDSQGRIWIGTLDGLNVVQPDGSMVIFQSRDGLPNGVIQGLLVDSDDHVWASSNKGIFEIVPTNFPEIKINSYDTVDGLQGSEYVLGAFYKSANGELFFGGLNGLNSFYPQNIQQDRYVPPVVFTSFKIFNEQIPLRHTPDGSYEPMVLSHRQNFISFEFAALDYAFPEKIQYQYKMEGVDQEWINAGTRRFANYNDLEGGAYAFKVRATNHDGLWKETPISLELRVIPPFWKTTWFMILCAGLVAALVAYRINELSQSKQILEERVSERTRAYEQANQELVRTQNLLVEAAHQAGMAEIAVDVLHNIGNALNSMMVSCDILQEKLQNHQTVELLGKICAKMESGELNLETAQGQTRLIASLRKLVGLHEGVWSEMKEESDLLHEKTLHILDIVRAQQDHAMRATYEEDIFLDQLVQDAIKIQSGSLKKHQVQVVLNVPHIQVRIAKTKLAQVLVNLVKNAIEALKSEPPSKARKIRIFVRQLDQHVHLVIEDNGMGIPPENLKRIFNYGFSGKPQGRGFGLHFCANAMTEMNGRILVESPGVGLGSVFTLELPVAGESFAMP